MSAIELLFGESSFLRLLPTTETNGKITDFGTKQDFLASVKVNSSWPAPASTADVQWFTTTGANNNRYSVPDKSKNYNAMDGTVISEASGESVYKFDCEVTVTKTQRNALVEAYQKGEPIFGIKEMGKSTTTGECVGYEYILGRITELTENQNAGPTTIAFTISSSKTIAFPAVTPKDHTDFNTECTGVSNKLTPVNEPEHTITALTTQDWDRLIIGEIVYKDKA